MNFFTDRDGNKMDDNQQNLFGLDLNGISKINKLLEVIDVDKLKKLLDLIDENGEIKLKVTHV